MTTSRTFIAIVMLVLIAGAAALFFYWRSEAADIEQSLERLAGYEAAVAARPQLEAELKRVQQESASLAGLVSGASAPLAGANMQNAVRTIVGRSGGEIRSSQNLPPSSADGFEKIEIAYDVTLPMNQLRDLLYQLETAAPFLFLDRFNLETQQNLSQRPDGTQPQIDIHFVARGYRWVGG